MPNDIGPKYINCKVWSIFFCVSFIFDMSTLRADVGYVPDEFDLK